MKKLEGRIKKVYQMCLWQKVAIDDHAKIQVHAAHLMALPIKQYKECFNCSIVKVRTCQRYEPYKGGAVSNYIK